MNKEPDGDVEKVWEEFWLPVLTKEDGSIDMEQIKKELYDYHIAMHEWSMALCSLTNGKLSKTNYTADSMITAIEEAFEDREDVVKVRIY